MTGKLFFSVTNLRSACETTVVCTCGVVEARNWLLSVVWGSIAFNGVGSLHKIEGRLNAVGYKAILADKMLADGYVLIGHNFVFQQDNSPNHTARSPLQWTGDNDVTVLDWPPCSPEVNPIENLWRDLKVAANAHHPRDGEELWSAVQTAWTEMPGDRMRTLVESIPHLIEGVRKKRWKHQILRENLTWQQKPTFLKAKNSLKETNLYYCVIRPRTAFNILLVTFWPFTSPETKFHIVMSYSYYASVAICINHCLRVHR